LGVRPPGARRRRPGPCPTSRRGEAEGRRAALPSPAHRPHGRHLGGGFTTYAAGAGLPFLVSLYAERRFGVSSTVLGLVLVGFGVAAIILAPFWGVVSGRIGSPFAGAIGLIGCGVVVALIPSPTTAFTLAGVLALLGAAAALTLRRTGTVPERTTPGAV
jgi:predicted MFS family arabinose efflux permease